MEENVLKDFETFNEFPDKCLKVNKKSDYYFVRKLNDDFIAKKKLDSMLVLDVLGNQKLLKENSYYDINTGKIILNTKSISNIDGSNEEFLSIEKKVNIICLSSILNIDENGVYYLTQEDLKTLINFNEENSKTYGMKPRKYYF